MSWLILLLAVPSSETATRSLTLAEAVELALATDPSLGAAKAIRDRSEVAVLRAQLDRVSLTVDAQVQELWARSNIGGDRGESFDGVLGLSYGAANLTVPIFSGFRVESEVHRAQDLEEAAKEDVLATRRSIALSVARAYWAVRKIDLLREVQALAVERARNAEGIAASRVNAGLAPPIDTNRAVSRRLLEEATLADLEGELAEATAELAVALGIRGPIVLSDRPRAREGTPPPIDRLLAEANRPELAAAKKRLDAQEQEIDIALSGYYPQLSAFALFQYGNNPLQAGVGARAIFPTANPFANLAGDFQAGAVLSINLFDTLNTFTAVKDARYEELRLAEEMRRVARIVEAEVRRAREKVVRFQRVRQRLLRAEEVARDNVDIIRKRYENGEALVLELLDSEIELLDVERRIADATSELELAWLELQASLGDVIGERQW